MKALCKVLPGLVIVAALAMPSVATAQVVIDWPMDNDTINLASPWELIAYGTRPANVPVAGHLAYIAMQVFPDEITYPSATQWRMKFVNPPSGTGVKLRVHTTEGEPFSDEAINLTINNPNNPGAPPAPAPKPQPAPKKSAIESLAEALVALQPPSAAPLKSHVQIHKTVLLVGHGQVTAHGSVSPANAKVYGYLLDKNGKPVKGMPPLQTGPHWTIVFKGLKCGTYQLWVWDFGTGGDNDKWCVHVH